MASMRMLVFGTMLYCLFKVGCTSLPSKYSIEAGYYSMATLWHGVKSRIGIWEIPDVPIGTSSGSYIAVINDSPGVEIIAAGVHVNPSLYGDNKLHFFTYWMSSSFNQSKIDHLNAVDYSASANYSKGCYNTLCQGFVVADGNNLYPGESLSPPFSTYDLEEIRIILRIKRDERTGDWSLYREDKGGPIGGMTLLGWWPKTLFNSQFNHAERIAWIGSVNYDGEPEKLPSMGSGYYASALNNRAASFSDCFGFDGEGNGFEVKDYKALAKTDKPVCYSVSEWYHTKHKAQRHFFYGGPGLC